VPFVQETPEMFVRWAQFCAMGTIVRFHTNNCCDHRPWSWGTEAEAAIQKILKLRYSLMPTLVAAGRRATLDGTPVVQRLDLTWPELADSGANRPDQYLFADGNMLVAPVIPFNGSDPVARHPTNGTANASRTVWVPPGQWQDGWTGATVSGPALVEVKDCPLDQIPMWHKKGSLLLTTEPESSTSEQSWDELTVNVFPFKLLATVKQELLPLRSASAVLYDTKASHEAPPATTLQLEQHGTSGMATLTIGATNRLRRWRLRIHLLPGEQLEAVYSLDSSDPGAEPTSLQLSQWPVGALATGRQPVRTREEAASTITSTAIISTPTIPQQLGTNEGTSGSVVEAVVETPAGYNSTFSFEVYIATTED